MTNDSLEKATMKDLSRTGRIIRVHGIAANLIDEAFPDKYDTMDIIIEPKSYYDADWYLWIAAAKCEANDTWSVWTLNLSTMSLNDGDYDIDPSDLNRTIAGRKYGA